MSPRPFINDQYAALRFKRAVFGDPNQERPNVTNMSWVDDFDARRLAAYDLLGAYRNNAASNFLPNPAPMRLRQIIAEAQTGELVDVPDYRDKQREYGDAGLLVLTGRSLLLGDDQTLHVPDTEDADDNGQPTEPAKRATMFAEWLAEFADTAGLLLHLHGMELNAVGDGDGVLALGWDSERGRPTIRKYDPGWYFPDLTDDPLDWPTTVHVAWEVSKGGKQWLRRQTWTLVPTDAPWKPAYSDKADATVRCWYYDRLFDLGKLRDGDTVYSLPLGEGEGRDPVDMPIDFLPVLHTPNTADDATVFGRSLLLWLAQVLDDLMGADSDLAENSSLVGSSPMVTKGVAGALPVGPGAKLDLPMDGDARLLDTSRSLDALIKYDTHLLDRLAVNSRIAAALLGRINTGDASSGIMLDLRFRATANLVREMRLIRDVKYPLLLKMLMRLAQAYQVLPAGPTPRAELRLGPYLPADKTGTAARVAQLLPVHGMSVQTAVQELMEAGFAIDDAEAEVDRIKAEWGALAVEAVEATGDANAGREILGLDPLPTPVPVVEPQ